MDALISKLSSYNILNYLFPGVVFSVLIEKYTNYSLIQENLLVGIFLYYFIGMIISRLGSLFIEKFLIKVGFLDFTKYEDYLQASQVDQKIDILSEQNNLYRSMITVIIITILVIIYERIVMFLPGLSLLDKAIVLIVLLILFLFSYKKQTQYIRKRILSNLSK